LAGLGEENGKNLERLAGELESGAAFAEFLGVEVGVEGTETEFQRHWDEDL
jgi:hypothetical protein